MVRRRSSKSKPPKTDPRPLDKRDARVNRWNNIEDMPMDEEDQCAPSLLSDDLRENIKINTFSQFTHPRIVFSWRARKSELMKTGTRRTCSR